MIARTFWGAKADQASNEKGSASAKPQGDDLLDARIDDEGQIAQPRRGREPSGSMTPALDELDLAVQKLSEGLEAIERQSRTPARAPEPQPARAETRPEPEADAGGGRDFVAHSLDRLEARLEALSKRLQQRGGSARGPASRRAPIEEEAPRASAEDLAAELAESQRLAEAEEERAVEAAAARERQAEIDRRVQREAEVEAEERRRKSILADARRHAEAIEARRQAELAEARRQSELDEARREAEVAEARHRAEMEEARLAAEEAEALREAEVARARREAEEAEKRREIEVARARREAEEAEARRLADAEALADQLRRQAEEAAAERRRLAEEAESIRLADLAEARRQAEAAEERRRAEMEAAKREAEISAARRDAEMAATLERQFANVEARIEILQKGLDENQVEPVRGELLALVEDMSELSRGGRATSTALDAIGGRLEAIGARLDEMEVKLNAARNMAGNRLGDIQDRLSGLVERIDEIEVEIPGFDAVRENQSAILERFDRMEGLVEHLASAEELLDRVDGLKRQLQTIASQREVARVEEQILKLAERLDALPGELSDEDDLARIEGQLGGLAGEFAEARRQQKTVASALEEHLTEVSAQLRDVAETGRTPDLSGIEERISVLGTHLAEDRRFVGDTLSRLERRLGNLAAAIEAQEDDASAEILAGLTEKMNVLSAAIDAQDAPGARRDLGGLDRKLDQLGQQLAAQAEHLSRRQIEPLETRLDDMQGHLEELVKRAQDSSAVFRPLAQKLQDISERVSSLGAIEERLAGIAGRSADPRALQTQLDSIVSRLELLKGRSIDPARLNDLFDRIEVAIRALTQERFERLEHEQDAGKVPADHFEKLEKKLAETAGSIVGDRFARLERKLDEIGGAFLGGGEILTQADLTELRSDLVALRREVRAVPGFGQSEPNFGELMRTIAKRLDRLPQGEPATVNDLEAQMERIARILDDPSYGRAALTQIETSLKTIEKRLDDTRRSLGYRPPREVGDVPEEEMESVAGLARALSDDVTTLKTSAEVSEKKTKDAIDAVQDTLEAVVKRMAFLERDADAEEKRSGETRPAEAEATPAPKRPAASEAEPPTGGLLSRFTSRQLLKRATGGRAESFSPEPEESDEVSDLPLEPGTDSPLSSSLTGAPSSDTEFMSGARKPRAAKSAALATGAGDREPATVDDDFLAAARRAARAAAAEASTSDEEMGASDEAAPKTGRGSRYGLIAAAAAAVIAVAAVVVAGTRVWPYDAVVALFEDMQSRPSPVAVAPSPPVAPASPPSESADLTAGPNIAPVPDETPTVAEVPPPAADELRPEDPAEIGTESAAAEDVMAPSAAADVAAEAPPAAAAPTTETEIATAAPAEPTPAVPPSARTATGPAATPPAASPTDGATVLASLPESIGPDRLRDAALAGDKTAAFEVGARYAEGRGVAQDMPTAVAWYERSGDLGLAPAQYRLGSIYEKGLGVPRDLAKAQEWYRRAAEAGNVKAMHNLAVLYAEGAGGEPDLDRAAELFRQAAERGVRDSQFNLAILHARGLGVSQDLVEAYKWFAVAASSGDEESAKRRDIIAEALSEGDRATAEAAAAAFQPLPLISEANEVLMPDNGWTDEDNSTSVEVNSDNDLVALVQRLLAENGYDPGPADGLLGEKTIEAISEFQTQAGLPRTGAIDAGLVAALQNRST